MPDFDEQLQILRRGVEQIVPEDEFRKKLERSLRTNRPLRVKYGIDPTGIDVHLGHTVPLRKLRQFQDLGHTAIIIIGNYTALVGDPSGRDETRAKLSEAQVEANARDYLKQVGRIIDLDRAEVHHNGDWFSKWSFLQVLDLMRLHDSRPDERPRRLRQADRRREAGLSSRMSLSPDARLGFGRDPCRYRAWRDRAALQSAGRARPAASPRTGAPGGADDADTGRHRWSPQDGQEPGKLHWRGRIP